MRRLAAALLLACLAGCKVVSGEAPALQSDLLASYDIAQVQKGDWVEYAQRDEEGDEPNFTLRYSCVDVQPGATWVEVHSSTIKDVYLLSVDPVTGWVKRGWKAKPGEPAREIWVKSIGDPAAGAKIPEGGHLSVDSVSTEAVVDGKTLIATRVTTIVRNPEADDTPVDETAVAVYAEGIPFPVAWNRIPSGQDSPAVERKGYWPPSGGVVLIKRTTEDGSSETRLVKFGHDATATMKVEEKK